MLEVTNLRDGEVLDNFSGIETEEYLEIKVQGIADPQAEVTVNGQKTERCDRNFSADIRLTEKINKVTVKSDSYWGEKTLTLTVVWNKKVGKVYNFFFDDVIFCLRSIAKERPESVFDELFFGRLKKIHDLYGTKFTLNLFFSDDHHKDFTLKEMPEDYREEFAENADWLKFSFHAYSEFPDRPYQNATAEKLAADYDLIREEVKRFAGEESFIAPSVIHWGMTHPDNFRVLTERGMRVFTGMYIGAQTNLTEKHAQRVTDVGYHYEKDVACFMGDKHWFYDRFNDIYLHNGMVCCNLETADTLKAKFAKLAENPENMICLASHEQYSYPDYFNYLPYHLDLIEMSCRLAAEAGYKPVYFTQLFSK